MRRMLNRKVSGAFERWQSEAAQMEGEQMAMKRGLMRLVHVKLAASFGSWRMAAAEMKRALHGGGGAGRRMMNRKHDALVSIKITTLEDAGALQYYNGSAWIDVTLNQVITLIVG